MSIASIAAPSFERRAARLADPALTEALSHFVSRRVPASDVDDIVQSTLTEALEAERAPEDGAGIRRWVHGIARHKVADWFRSRRREVPLELEGDAGEAGLPAPAAPAALPEGMVDAKKLLLWAELELPAGGEHARTLGWLLREGQGETLEAIAADEALEPPRVRQRVARLRRHFRARWALHVAALATLVAIALVLALAHALRKPREQVAPRAAPTFEPLQLAPLPVPLPRAPVPESRPAARAPAPSAQWTSAPVSTSAPPPAKPVGKMHGSDASSK
jgi:DNA-directed RNA polymerase specialized sigma24 family protein